MDSHGARNLAEKIGSGKLSVAAAADCASAFQSDESVKVVEVGTFSHENVLHANVT